MAQRHDLFFKETFSYSEHVVDFLKAVINYIFEATEIEDNKLIEAFNSVSEKGKEIAMTTAEKLRHEGREEGKFYT